MRTIGVKLTADTTGYISGLARAAAATKDFTGQMDKAAKAGKLDHVADQAARFGIAGVAAFGLVVKSAADFDKQMSAVSAATHAGSAELGTLRAAALQAGKDTQYSATQAAQGITELSKAGVATADILGGGLKGALSLAAAGQIEVGDAAEIAASAMTQFKLSGSQIPHVADLLAAGAGKAQGSVHDLSMALDQSGLIAAQTGLSIEDTTGTLAAFASAGLLGSDAGTSFKTMLQALQAPSSKSADLMKQLGISAYDTQGNFIGITALAGQLKTQLSTLTPELRANALAQIFGSDATRAASVLYEQGSVGIQKWIDKTNAAGYAATTAAKLTDNLSGDLERLKGSLETLAISSGSGAASGLRTLTQAANGAVNAFLDLPAGLQSAAVQIAGVSGGLLLTAAGFIKARKASREFIDEIRAIGPMGVSAADGIGKIAGVAGRLGLVGVAVTGAFMGFKLFGDWVEKKHAPVKADIDKLTASIKDFAATGQVTGELASKYGANLQKIGAAVVGVTKGMADLKQAQADVASGLSDPSVYANWNPVDPQALQRIRDLDTSLTQLVSSGGANQAAIFMQQLAGSGRLTADQFQRLTGMLPNYTQATQGAATANSGLAKGFGSTEANAKSMTSSLQEAINAGQTMTDVWTQLNGATLGTDRAMLAAQQSIDDVRAAFKANKNAVDDNSEAALKNRVAIGSAAEAAVKAAQAKYEETGSIKAANVVYDGYIGQLRKTLTQSVHNETKVNSLIGAYAKMPKEVTTDVKIIGAKTVAAALASLGDMQKALKNGTVPAGGWNAASGALAKAINDPKMRAGGGPVNGPGSETSDSIPAMLSNNEYVVQASSAKKLGLNTMEHINKYGELPHFAAGGLVNWPYPVTAAMTRIPSQKEAAAAVTVPMGSWPSSPAAQRGDSGVWRSIVSLVKASGIPYEFGNAYRPGDPLWHGSGRAVDFMGFNQDRLANFFMARKPQVLELIHRTDTRDYGVTRGHDAPMPHQWPLHRNHLHVAMAAGGVLTEPVLGFGASGRSYSLAENGPETVMPGVFASTGGGTTYVTNVTVQAGYIVSEQQLQDKITRTIDKLKSKGRF